MPQSADVRAVGEFAASRYGTFTMSQAAENGLTRNDLRRLERDGIVERIRPSVWRFAGQPIGWKHRLHAATVGVRAVSAFASATAMHGVDGMDAPPDQLEILCHHSAAVTSATALVHKTRWLPNADVIEVDGIMCTTLARTLCDMAPRLDDRQLVRFVDDIQRRDVSLLWIIERALKLRSGTRSGPTRVLDVVRRRLGGYVVPESWFERLLSECLRSPLLGDIVRQHVLRDPSGAFIARFDLAIPWAQLGIEGHSRSFHLGEAAERYDEDRDMRAAQQGWEITYLGFAATRNPSAVRRDIELIVRRRMADLDLRPLSATAA